MDRDTFLRIFQAEVQTYTQLSVTESGGWIVKGFVDVFRRLYAVPRDTKVVARVLETLLAPRLAEFAEQHGYDLRFPQQQNFYPDVAFVSRADPQEKHAVDIKSSYRTGGLHINGMALGAYTGYFRDRNSLKNALFSYNSFQSHLVLGIIYSRAEPSDEPQPFAYALDDLAKIDPVIRDLTFFVQPKFCIASARPGSGNTRNIGSVTLIEQLIAGRGPFSQLGERIYDDYWMNYLNADMARKIGSVVPYNNLKSYAEHRNKGPMISVEEADRLDALDTGKPAGEDA